jgi:hypothetical protein
LVIVAIDESLYGLLLVAIFVGLFGQQAAKVADLHHGLDHRGCPGGQVEAAPAQPAGLGDPKTGGGQHG